MADDVEAICLYQAAYALKMYASEQTDEALKGALQKAVHNVELSAQTIATLRADLAKAVEGLERIKSMAVQYSACSAVVMVSGFSEIEQRAQSLIKELRP